MEHEILLPSPGESVSEAEVAVWHKKEGDLVQRDEILLEVETDKATLEIVAEYSGQLKILAAESEVVQVGGVLGKIIEVAGMEAAGVKPQKEAASPSQNAETLKEEEGSKGEVIASPAARKMITESDLNPAAISATGKGGRVTKADVLDHIENSAGKDETRQPPRPTGQPGVEITSASSQVDSITQTEAVSPASVESPRTLVGSREEKSIPIPRIRKKIAQRLKAVQNTAAILTTFNEVDMSEVIRLRNEYKESFEKKHGIKLGFMGFFVKAAVEALRRVPDVNAEWREDSLVYKSYQDIGVAVSTGKGLVVPVVRNAADLSLAGVEKEIARLAQRGREGSLGIDEMSGGTFTITNGGVFGSLLSTPILNPPQTAILGMHKTEKRPVVVGDEIVIRPMMYVAMSYDHRVIDGKEAVQFLVTIKECIENPVRVLLEV